MRERRAIRAQVSADAAGDPCSGVLDRIPGQVSVPRGRLHLRVTEQLTDHREALAQGQRPRCIPVANIREPGSCLPGPIPFILRSQHYAMLKRNLLGRRRDLVMDADRFERHYGDAQGGGHGAGVVGRRNRVLSWPSRHQPGSLRSLRSGRTATPLKKSSGQRG